MTNQLAPCPWCGGKAEIYSIPDDRRKKDPIRSYFARCVNHHLTDELCRSLSKTKPQPTEESAITAWNHRVYPEWVHVLAEFADVHYHNEYDNEIPEMNDALAAYRKATGKEE